MNLSPFLLAEKFLYIMALNIKKKLSKFPHLYTNSLAPSVRVCHTEKVEKYIPKRKWIKGKNTRQRGDFPTFWNEYPTHCNPIRCYLFLPTNEICGYTEKFWENRKKLLFLTRQLDRNSSVLC